MKKTFSIILAILLMGLTITGCGSEGNRSSQDTLTNSSVNSDETTPTVKEVEEKSDREINVSMGQMGVT
jgi:predicted small lipoprotein YifL